MSDFRKFCIGFLVGFSALATWINHGGQLRADADNPAGLVSMGLLIGCLAVSVFGGRRA